MFFLTVSLFMKLLFYFILFFLYILFLYFMFIFYVYICILVFYYYFFDCDVVVSLQDFANAAACRQRDSKRAKLVSFNNT